MKEFYDEMEGKTLLELAAVMNETRIKLEAAKEVKTGLQKKYDVLRLNLIPPLMDDDGITSMNVDGIGRLGVTSDIYASIPADTKNEAWNWLRENDHNIIKETVNAGTLKATLKAIIKKGEIVLPVKVMRDSEGEPLLDEHDNEIPLLDGDENQIPLFKVSPFSRATITKTG